LLRLRRGAPLQFKKGSDEVYRPYIWVVVRGPSGREIEIRGLVDSGADKSVLPVGYAALLGYSSSNLKPEEIGQVEGKAQGKDAQVPCTAHVRGRPRAPFSMWPLFVDTLEPLWGRADLMHAYVITISQRDKELRLRRR
jgi:hypothetical protein